MAGQRGNARPGRQWSRRFNHPYTARKSPPPVSVPIVGADQTAPWALYQAGFGPALGYRGYNPPSDGVPASWPGPGVQIPAGVPAGGQVVSIKPDLTSVLNGSLDTALATYFASMPAGAYCTAWHEAEIANIGTQSQIIAMHTRIYGIFNNNAPAACSYGQIIAVQSAFSGHSGFPVSAWMCTPANGGALLDFYGMDNAPQNATITYADNINTAINQMVAGGVPPNGPWTITENGYHPVWTPSQSQWYADGWCVARAIGALHYLSFFSPTAPNAYVLWPAPSVDTLRVLQDIAAVARNDPRSPPAQTPARDAKASFTASASTTSLTATFATQPTAGAKVLVTVQCPSGATVTVTDNGATTGTFVLDSSCLNATSTIPSVRVYRADSIALPATGTYAVTVTLGAAAKLTICANSYTGVQNGPPSSSSAITGTSNNPAVDPVTPDDQNSLFFSAFFCDSTNAAESMLPASAEFTLQQTQTNGSTNFPGAVADALVANPAPRQGGFTLPDSPDWCMVMASYGAFPLNMQQVPGAQMAWAQAPAPVAQVTVNAGVASATCTAAVNQPPAATNANAGLAASTATAEAPAALVEPIFSVIGPDAATALAPVALVEPFPPAAGATGAALFNTAGGTISLTLTAINPLTITSFANNPAALVQPAPANAAATAAALSPSVTATVGLPDSGAGSDLLAVTQAIALADSGTGSDALVATVAIALADSGAGSDLLAATIPAALADSGAGADSLAVTQPTALADSGAGADSLAVTQPTALADAGTGADALLAGQATALADSGAGSDAVSVAAAVPLADSGTATTTLAVSQPTALADSGAGTDSLAVTQATALTDSGTGSDTLAAGVATALADSGAGTDALTVLISAALADAGTGTEALSLSAAAPLGDAGTGADSLSVRLALTLSDTGTGSDTLGALQPVSLADSGSGAETGFSVFITISVPATGVATVTGPTGRALAAVGVSNGHATVSDLNEGVAAPAK